MPKCDRRPPITNRRGNHPLTVIGGRLSQLRTEHGLPTDTNGRLSQRSREHLAFARAQLTSGALWQTPHSPHARNRCPSASRPTNRSRSPTCMQRALSPITKNQSFCFPRSYDSAGPTAIYQHVVENKISSNPRLPTLATANG